MTKLHDIITKIKTNLSHKILIIWIFMIEDIDDLPHKEIILSVLEASPEATIITNSIGNILLANYLMEELFGYSKIELINLSIEELMPIRFRAKHTLFRETYTKKPFVKPMSIDSSSKLNCFGLKKNAEEFPVDISLSPLTLLEQTFTLVSIKDLTPCQIYEQNLKETAGELAKQTTLLYIAEQHCQQREEFVDTICHEIRNPLTGIYGGLSLLQESLLLSSTELSTQSQKNLDIIVQSSKQLKVIVDDVLTLSKLESDKIELNENNFELTAFIKDTLKLFTIELEQKSLNLLLNIPQEPIWLKADHNQLSQIIINLMTNAIKFTDYGSITFNANVEHDFSVEKDIIVNFSIQDTGIGMSTQEIEQLFERFSQANRRISIKYGGSGLGLSISKKIIELMGGNIRVKSQKSQGTIFYFFIKCSLAVEPEQQLTASENTTIYHISELRYKKVLIVEDNEINATILYNMLNKTGCHCKIIKNGQEALELFEINKFHLILMDLEIPIINGQEVTRQIRLKENTHRRRHHTIIIGISGYSRPQIKASAIESGMDDYLTKPYNQKELFDIILKNLTTQTPNTPPPLLLHQLSLLDNTQSSSKDSLRITPSNSRQQFQEKKLAEQPKIKAKCTVL